MPSLKLNGMNLFYRRYPARSPEGAPVVLLHGLGSCHQDWPLQITALTDERTVITPDLRYHGRSGAPRQLPSMGAFAADVGALLEHELGRPAHVVGLSLGGAVALQLALTHPEQLHSLVIVNGFSRLKLGIRGWRRGLGRLYFVLSGQMKRLGDWVAEDVFPDPGQAALRRQAAARIGGNRPLAYLLALGAAARFNVADQIHRIHLPSLIVAGQADTIVPLQAKRELAERMPNARLMVIERSGHATPVDAWQAFNHHLLSFLSEVERGSGSS